MRYAIASGADGATYPGVASEVSELSTEERLRLVAVVQDELAGRLPLIVGISSTSAQTSATLAHDAQARGAAAFMVAAPADRKDTAGQVAFFAELAGARVGADHAAERAAAGGRGA